MAESDLTAQEWKEKISQMLDLVFNVSAEKEKRDAMTDLLVLARNEASAKEIFQKETVSKIAELIKVEKNEEANCSAICIVGELCKNNIKRTESIMRYVGLLWCLEIMNSTSPKIVNASQYCLQNILNTYSGMNNERDAKPDKTLCETHKNELDIILSCLLNSITNTMITGLARDAIIELITHNIHTALNWAEQLVELRGLQKLLEISSQLEKFESLFDITSSTRTIISMCLAKIYENMYCDDDRRTFIKAIEEFIDDKLLKSDTESKVGIVVAITTLIFGPLDVVGAVIFKQGIFQIILRMSKTDDVLQQKVACECIVAAMTKYKKANWFVCQCINILENLYQSKDDSIRVRALIGLCKISKFEKSILRRYTTIEPFADGATKKLAEICRRFLINPKKEKDMRKWAVDGLSYLTIIVDVKKELIKDQQAVKAMIELAETNDQSVIFGLTIILVNLCGIYDVKFEEDLIPELIEFMMFTKHYFLSREPQLILNDDESYKNRQRARALVEVGVISALVRLAKTDNQNCRQLIALVFSVICAQQKLRKIVVEQGGVKALLSLALNGTDKGKKFASRALMHLALTIDLEVAFPGQIMIEVVQPIINLLNSKFFVNNRCEALTALCNLASVNNMRKHIFKAAGFEKIEDYMHDDNDKLKRKAAQLINNLVLCHEVAIQYCEPTPYRVGYLTLLFEDKDKDTVKAVVGTVAMLTMVSKKACEEIIYSDYSLKFLHNLRNILSNPNDDIQLKGYYTKIALNLINCSKDIVANDDAILKEEFEELASLALKAAAEWDDKIYGNVEGNESAQSTDGNMEHVD
ncbi:protein unc-45 homolog B-like [Temnothorax longispinosus]|uniref:protein unc-45 homolog B-like n=1 Tax=Temnothorax longispinosus TaxID=300112 RepID=UPI003A98F5F3